MKQQTVSVRDIMNRVGIGDDTIRKHGFGVSDSMPIQTALEILKPRTVAAGRWPAEKAEKAKMFLAELQRETVKPKALETENKTEPMPETSGIAADNAKGKLGIWARLSGVSELDIVFGVNVLFAVYGLLYQLKEMGIPAAVAFCGVSIHAMRMCKNRKSQVTAQAGISAVWVLEFLAFFIHLTMINLRLWETGYKSKLPFSVWENNEIPFIVAAILAGLLSLASVYSVAVTLAKMKEEIEAENYERDHGIKY